MDKILSGGFRKGLPQLVVIIGGRRFLHVSTVVAHSKTSIRGNSSLVVPKNSDATKFQYVSYIPNIIKKEATGIALELARDGARIPLGKSKEIEAAEYLRNIMNSTSECGDLLDAVTLFGDRKVSGFIIEDVIGHLNPLEHAKLQVATIGDAVKTDSYHPDYAMVRNKIKSELPNQLLVSSLVHPLVFADTEVATPIYVLASREEGVAPQHPHVDVIVGEGDEGSAVDVIVLTEVSDQGGFRNSYGVSTYAISVPEVLKYFSPQEKEFLSKKVFVINRPEGEYGQSVEAANAARFSILQRGRNGDAMVWDGNGSIGIIESADSVETREILARINLAVADLISKNLAVVAELNNSIMAFRNYDKDGENVLHGRLETQPSLGEGGRPSYSSDPERLFAPEGIIQAGKRQVTRYAFLENGEKPVTENEEVPTAHVSKAVKKSISSDPTQTETKIR